MLQGHAVDGEHGNRLARRPHGELHDLGDVALGVAADLLHRPLDAQHRLAPAQPGGQRLGKIADQAQMLIGPE